MTLGPLEFFVVGFEGNHFTGKILPELRTARGKGIVRVVDLLFVKKDESGDVQALELHDLSDEEAQQYMDVTNDLSGMLTLEDIELVANNIPSNSSAAIVLIEHTWAIGLKEAVRNAGGVVLAGGLVAPAVLQMLEEELAISQDTTRTRVTE